VVVAAMPQQGSALSRVQHLSVRIVTGVWTHTVLAVLTKIHGALTRFMVQISVNHTEYAVSMTPLHLMQAWVRKADWGERVQMVPFPTGVKPMIIHTLIWTLLL
jgi:hypothetical protein